MSFFYHDVENVGHLINDLLDGGGFFAIFYVACFCLFYILMTIFFI